MSWPEFICKFSCVNVFSVKFLVCRKMFSFHSILFSVSYSTDCDKMDQIVLKHCDYNLYFSFSFYHMCNWVGSRSSHQRCLVTTLLKRNSGKGIFLWILRNFLEHIFYRTLLGDWGSLCRSSVSSISNTISIGFFPVKRLFIFLIKIVLFLQSLSSFTLKA